MLAAVSNLLALTIELLRFLPSDVHIGLGFHGFYWILIGYLIFRSTFLPRILSLPMTIAGLCWLTYLSPPIANYFSRYILASVLVLEGLVFLSLLVMGVNSQRWREQVKRRERPFEFLFHDGQRMG